MRYPCWVFLEHTAQGTGCNGRSCLFCVVTSLTGEYAANELCKERAGFVLVRNWRPCGEILTSSPLGLFLLEACSHNLIHFSLVCEKDLTNRKKQQQYCTWVNLWSAVLLAVQLGEGTTSTWAEAFSVCHSSTSLSRDVSCQEGSNWVQGSPWP